MENVVIPISIPKEVILSLNTSTDDLKTYMRIYLAMMFFKDEKLTLGKAIQLSGVDRYEFEKVLAENDIPLFSTGINQVNEDIAKLDSL